MEGREHCGNSEEGHFREDRWRQLVWRSHMPCRLLGELHTAGWAVPSWKRDGVSEEETQAKTGHSGGSQRELSVKDKGETWGSQRLQTTGQGWPLHTRGGEGKVSTSLRSCRPGQPGALKPKSPLEASGLEWTGHLGSPACAVTGWEPRRSSALAPTLQTPEGGSGSQESAISCSWAHWGHILKAPTDGCEQGHQSLKCPWKHAWA